MDWIMKILPHGAIGFFSVIFIWLLPYLAGGIYFGLSARPKQDFYMVAALFVFIIGHKLVMHPTRLQYVNLILQTFFFLVIAVVASAATRNLASRRSPDI